MMAPLKNCPDCAAPVDRSAQKCRCGWIRTGFSAQAPAKAVEPVEEMPWGARQAAYKRAADRFRSNARAHPRPQPLEHWRRVLADPAACALAKQMAREAIEELEGRQPTEERISIDAEIQETARRIAKALGEDDERARDPA